MTSWEHTDKTQLRAASPNVNPSGVLVRQRHLTFEGDVHCSGVYSDLMKLSTQSLAQLGTMLNSDESDASLEVSAVTQTSNQRTVMSIPWIGRTSIVQLCIPPLVPTQQCRCWSK